MSCERTYQLTLFPIKKFVGHLTAPPVWAGQIQVALEGLRPAIARAAQQVVDEWPVESGGVCDIIAETMSGLILDAVDCNVRTGGHPGDDHAWLIVGTGRTGFRVDIPPGVYETGGGYTWKRIEEARIRPEDVIIERLPPGDYFTAPRA